MQIGNYASLEMLHDPFAASESQWIGPGQELRSHTVAAALWCASRASLSCCALCRRAGAGSMDNSEFGDLPEDVSEGTDQVRNL